MKKRHLNLKNIFLVFFIIIFIISFYNIFIWFYDNYHTKKMTKLFDNAIKSENNIITDDITYELINEPLDKNDSYYKFINEPFLNINFEEIKKINPDIVSYIYVPGTSVSYPVVKTNDNLYYLRHSLDKSYNRAGWIFMDYRNDPYEYGKNTIIYGHKRNDGTMFSSLSNTLKEEWFNNENNRLIKLSNEKENSIWQIFSVYKIEQESFYITTKFKTDELYEDFLNTIKNRSIFDFKTEVNIKDKILTLSTCYDYIGNRVVIHAKLIKKGI